MSVLNCPNCQTPAPPGAIFCDNCGFDLRQTAVGAQPAAPTFKAQEPGSGPTCSSCGHENEPGSMFCENCGARLVESPPAQQPSPPATPPASPPTPPPFVGATPPPAPPQPSPPPVPSPQQPAAPPPDQVRTGITGSLVIQGQDITLSLPSGKDTVVIGREDPVSGVFPDVDLDPYGAQADGVGRRHAQLTLQAGKVCIEDLDSVNGTALNRQKIPPRQPQPVKDGDEIRLGKMVLIYKANG